MKSSRSRDVDDNELMPVAFSVRGELSPDEGPPMTGEEYLMRVRWEANRCPDIVVSNIDPRSYDKDRTEYFVLNEILPAPPGLEYTAEWETYFLSLFENQRAALDSFLRSHENSLPSPPSSLPSIYNKQKWHSFCFSEIEGQASFPSLPPLTSIVLRLDHVGVNLVLRYHIEWLQEDQLMSSLQCQWFYSLLLRLELPLDAEMGSYLRELLKKTTLQRSKLSVDSQDYVMRLNIIICIVSKFFKQGNN